MVHVKFSVLLSPYGTCKFSVLLLPYALGVESWGPLQLFAVGDLNVHFYSKTELVKFY